MPFLRFSAAFHRIPTSPLATTRFASTKCALYIDRGIVVINKPTGLESQPQNPHGGGKNPDRSGGDEMTYLLADFQEKFNLKTPPFPVHRLDKATTGTLAFALTPSHARDLSQQFASRSTDKVYLALVRGGTKSFSASEGIIQNRINITDGRVTLADNVKEGKEALTEWELLASSDTAPLSLLKLRLRTGLKHQLRVHLAHALKTPILGDTLYASSKLPSAVTDIVNVPPDLMYLHASHLSFYRYRVAHPHKRLRLGITAPLPGFFTRICAKVGIAIPRELVQGGLFVDKEEIKGGIVEDLEGRWIG